MSVLSSPNRNASEGFLSHDFAFDSDLNIWKPKSTKEDFGYSDGDRHENYLFETIRAAKDRSVLSEELSRGMKDWPSIYHLHHQRCNIFRSISDYIDGPVLEIGAGCGVLTRFLGEEGHETFALEGSPRRASITAERCRDLANVHVVNANFQDFKPEAKFKTISLIGVLEYARVYFSGDGSSDPVDQMLKAVRKLLTPDGVLVVAIENKLGLKYFAGYNEDHFGEPMFGIQDQYSRESIVTFGRAELKAKIIEAGLSEVEFAFPFPDYKFPQAILSERAMSLPLAPKFSGLVAGANGSDRQKPVTQHFSMNCAIKPIMENGLGADLANSFIAIASAEADSIGKFQDTLALHYGSGDRKDEYLKVARISMRSEKLYVERSRLTDAIPSEEAPCELVLEDEFFSDGRLWTSALQDIFLKPNWTVSEIADWAKVWVDALMADANLGMGDVPKQTTTLPGAYYDAVPGNLIVGSDGVCTFIDLEWKCKEPIDFGFLFARGLRDAFFSVDIVIHKKQRCEFLQLIRSVGNELGLFLKDSELREYVQREVTFQRTVTRFPIVNEDDMIFLPTRPSEKVRDHSIRMRRLEIERRTKRKRALSRVIGRSYFK